MSVHYAGVSTLATRTLVRSARAAHRCPLAAMLLSLETSSLLNRAVAKERLREQTLEKVADMEKDLEEK